MPLGEVFPVTIGLVAMITSDGVLVGESVVLVTRSMGDFVRVELDAVSILVVPGFGGIAIIAGVGMTPGPGGLSGAIPPWPLDSENT